MSSIFARIAVCPRASFSRSNRRTALRSACGPATFSACTASNTSARNPVTRSPASPSSFRYNSIRLHAARPTTNATRIATSGNHSGKSHTSATSTRYRLMASPGATGWGSAPGRRSSAANKLRRTSAPVT
ncbi:MAG: hypothetical protein MUC34_11240 [Anaerolineae bacterium]|nr:hypothetical protein [Anaerolineae bacterium]